MAGSHVRVTRFSIVRARPESGYVYMYQRYPGTGFRCCNPGARYPYTPSRAAAAVTTITRPLMMVTLSRCLQCFPYYCRVDW